VVIDTGFQRPSANEKTEDMLQTWMLRADMNPLEAIHSGQDSSICGSRPLCGIVEQSGERTTNRRRACYVSVHQAPHAIYRAYKRGRYEQFEASRHLGSREKQCRLSLRESSALGRANDQQTRKLFFPPSLLLFHGRMVRLSSYGEPVAAQAGRGSPDPAPKRVRRAGCAWTANVARQRCNGWYMALVGPTLDVPLEGECPVRLLSLFLAPMLLLLGVALSEASIQVTIDNLDSEVRMSGVWNSASSRWRSFPCLGRCFARARSIRIRRIDSAAAAKKCPLLSHCWASSTSTSRRDALRGQPVKKTPIANQIRGQLLWDR